MPPATNSHELELIRHELAEVLPELAVRFNFLNFG